MNHSSTEKQPILVWGARYETGIPKIDQQHQKMVDLINALSIVVKKGESAALQSMLQELDYYIVEHLGYEELLFERYGYPGGEFHKQEHSRFVEQLERQRAEITAESLLEILRDWLRDHVLGSDMQYVSFLKQQMGMEEKVEKEKSTCNGVRVIAIDDEPEILQNYQNILDGHNHRRRSRIETELFAEIEGVGAAEEVEEEKAEHSFSLSVAAQGELGVDLARQALAEGAPYSVAFIDMRMPPGINGLETARRLRELDDRIYIIFVTAYADQSVDDIDKVIQHDVLYLRKPFVSGEIYQLTRSQGRSWCKDRQREASVTRAEMEVVEKASQAKDQFFAAMSHELRTPLTAMIGNSEILSELLFEPDHKNLLRSIEVSGHGLLALINDILDLSKIEAGKFSIDSTDYDLAALLEEIHYIFASRAADAGLQFEIRPPAALEQQLIGDGRRVGQILINLLGNAIKFTQKGAVSLEVAFDSSREWIHFRVTDQGIGMTPEAVERLFQPFEQADQSISGRFGGTGLGLHISQTLAELMKGTIRVESEEGKGSTFELRVPCQFSEKPAGEIIGRDRASTRSGSFSGHVLVAEDTPELQIMERRILTTLGIQVSVANNGKEAVEMALGQRFDLILMDMQMPEMDGIEATALLRQAGYEQPIIALTGNVMQKHQQQFAEAGCDGFLAKPIDRQLLIQLLGQYLPQHTEKERTAVTTALSSSGESLIDDDLRELFVERLTELNSQLRSASNEGRWVEVNQYAHTIKGSGSSFGHPELTQLAAAVCSLLDSGEVGVAAERNEQLLTEMARVITLYP